MQVTETHSKTCYTLTVILSLGVSPMRAAGIHHAPEDAEFQSWVGAFLQGLARNRDGSPDAMYGSKLGGLNSTPKKLANMRPNWWRLYRTPSWRPATPPLLRLTRTVSVVFPLAADPAAAGLVESLARLGGNATGFMSF